MQGDAVVAYVLLGDPAGVLTEDMAVSDLVALLGPPSSRMSGTAMLGMTGVILADPAHRSQIAGEEYWVWMRPEGTHNLVIEGDRLSNVHSAPRAGP